MNRCHLCQKDQATRQAGGLHWCSDMVACKHRARLRLGVPYPLSKQLLLHERGRR